MENVPAYIGWMFGFTTLLTIFLFYKASRYSLPTLILLLSWILLQAVVSLTGFYTVTDTFPPRIVFVFVPVFVTIISLFLSARGRQYLDQFSLEDLTILHIIRIPVEVVLLGLFLYKAVPMLITFEGINFDILSGITAPVVYYLFFRRKSINKKWLLAWNFICLALLINVVVHAVLSAPFSFQQFAFDQPNIAVLYFPYLWLPACVVPLVLLSHLVAIRQLLK